MQVCTELFRDDRFGKTWKASDNLNALNAVFEKEPAEMTRDDAMTVACDAIVVVVFFAQGFSALSTAAGVDETELMGTFTTHPLQPARAPTDEKNLRLGELALNICRDPQGLSAEELAGAWMLLWLEANHVSGLATEHI